MDEDDRLELGPRAMWFPGLGVSPCCEAMLERLELRDELLFCRCSECGELFFADESADLDEGSAA